MPRRTADENNAIGRLVEELHKVGDNSLPVDERLTALGRLREHGAECAIEADRMILQMFLQQQEALSEVQAEQNKMHAFIKSLTAPPYFPAVYLGVANLPQVQGAMVQTDNERRIVQMGEEAASAQLVPGDEVYLTHERNYLIAKAEGQSFVTGEVAAYSRSTGDGRLVLRSRDEEMVVLPAAALRAAGLKAGDGVRFNRATSLAFERIEPSKGEEYFLEDTPSDSFDEIGGLDREIAALKRALSVSLFHQDTAGRYKLKPKKSILMEGPPGNGKTKVARATCAWLGSLTHSGRSHFINVKPGALNSMWFGATEQKYREVFRVAREAAAAEPEVPVVMFWDEVDAIGASRGESLQRIDDRMLNAFMAELNGLQQRGNVFILSATNRHDALDPALVRAGRLGDLVLHFPPPNRRGARAILACHLPSDIPYGANGEGPEAAREALLDLAVARIFARNSDTELANLTLRDGKRRVVRGADLISGAQLEAIAQGAIERACLREAEGGPPGVNASDMQEAISEFFHGASRALTPRNARNYLHDLPQDVDVVRVDLVERKVTHPHRYRVEVACNE